MRIYLLAFVAIMFIGFGCKPKQTIKEKQNEIETGKLSGEGVYNSEEVGWSAKIPEGWDVITGKEQARLMENGAKNLKDATNVEMDISGMKQLLNLKKDMYNGFLSNIELLPENETATFEETDKQLAELMQHTYKSQGIPSSFLRSTEKIDDLEFYVHYITLYNADSTEVILNQRMYSRIINGYIFSMTVNYNNEADFKAQDEMIKTSKFRIRK